MGWKVNNFLLRGRLEFILGGICDIRDTNGEVVCDSNGKIIQNMGYTNTGEQQWSMSMPFTWGPPLTQWRGQQRQILSVILLVSGDKTDQMMLFVQGKLKQKQKSVRIPKALFLLYCTEVNLIQLTRSVPLRGCPKLEGYSYVMVKKASLWQILGSTRGHPLSKQAHCSSREVSAYGCLQYRVSVIQEYLYRFCLSQSS